MKLKLCECGRPVWHDESGELLCQECFDARENGNNRSYSEEPDLNTHHLVSLVCALIASGQGGTKQQMVQAAREILVEIEGGLE